MQEVGRGLVVSLFLALHPPSLSHRPCREHGCPGSLPAFLDSEVSVFGVFSAKRGRNTYHCVELTEINWERVGGRPSQRPRER